MYIEIIFRQSANIILTNREKETERKHCVCAFMCMSGAREHSHFILNQGGPLRGGGNAGKK